MQSEYLQHCEITENLRLSQKEKEDALPIKQGWNYEQNTNALFGCLVKIIHFCHVICGKNHVRKMEKINLERQPERGEKGFSQVTKMKGKMVT